MYEVVDGHLLFSEHYDYDVPDMEVTPIQRYTYERYKLDWLLQHGWTLLDVIEKLDELCPENMSLEERYYDWEKYEEFNCIQVFLRDRYPDQGYMRKLLDDKHYQEYEASL